MGGPLHGRRVLSSLGIVAGCHATTDAGDAAVSLDLAPPVEIGTAMHAVIALVTLPGAEDLAAVAASVCLEAGIELATHEVIGLDSVIPPSCSEPVSCDGGHLWLLVSGVQLSCAARARGAPRGLPRRGAGCSGEVQWTASAVPIVSSVWASRVSIWPLIARVMLRSARCAPRIGPSWWAYVFTACRTP